MKYMKRRGLRLFAVAALLPLMAASPSVQTTQPSAQVSRMDQAAIQQVTKLLKDFLAAVPQGNRQVFDNFFADDVIYTRAAGVTVNKAEIMRNIGVRATNEPKAAYDA